MPYSIENIRAIVSKLSEKRALAESAAEQRRAELYDALPRIKNIDETITGLNMKIFSEAISGKEGFEKRTGPMMKEVAELREARRACLIGAGYSEDYDDVRYECPICSDKGYDENGKMCDCMRRALVMKGFESSGMAKLISKQNFDNFDLGYYVGNDRAQMEKNLGRVKDFAAGITRGEYRNMLFMGTTGLGKTHLSSAVARTVIEGGCDVVYESAQNIFSDFEHERFFRSYGDASPSRTEKYFDCDLLIIDDLGTEVSNQFTVSCLYNLMNTRIVSEKSMLISTNVTKEEMLERYSDRILSRLFGEFEVCIFCGRDIRSQKLKK